MIWILIFSGFLLLVPNRAVADFALNVLILTLVMYLVQGLAVLTHFLGRTSLPKLGRTALYLLIVFQPYLALAVTACGVFDLWADFRKTTIKQENL